MIRGDDRSWHLAPALIQLHMSTRKRRTACFFVVVIAGVRVDAVLASGAQHSHALHPAARTQVRDARAIARVDVRRCTCAQCCER